MQISVKKIFQYATYLLTPENSEMSSGKPGLAYPLYNTRKLSESMKAIFWYIMAVLASLGISGLH